MAMIHADRRAQVEDAMDVDDVSRGPAQSKDSRVNALEKQLEHTRLSRQVAVPTHTDAIKVRLRDLGQPVTLFGEKPVDRRQRLRDLLTLEVRKAIDEGIDVDEAIKLISEGPKQEEDEVEEQEERIITGGPRLQEVRRELTRFSIDRAKKRLAYQKAESSIAARKHARTRAATKSWLSHYEVVASQVYGPRVTTALEFSPNGQYVAAGTWGGRVALLNLDLEEQIVLRGHVDHAVALAWAHGPVLKDMDASKHLSDVLWESNGIYLATGDGAGDIRLFAGGQTILGADQTSEEIWSTDATHTLQEHKKRVTAIAFYPNNKFLISGSHDEHWRLWDLQKSVSILSQRAHSREVHCLALNTDGSLLATGGLDSFARVWDLRTGTAILETDGHVQPVYGVDWSPNGYQFMSGSADGKVKIWDLRRGTAYGEVPAHQNGVAVVKWFQGTDGPINAALPPQEADGKYKPKMAGSFFLTAGFDKEIKIWSADDWQPIYELGAHAGNVTCLDVTADAKHLVTGSRDMTIKLWGQPDGSTINDVSP